MTGTFLDRDLREWEAYATTERGGLPEPGRILFRCVSESAVRSRALRVEGNVATAEARVAGASEEELRGLLEEAQEIQ